VHIGSNDQARSVITRYGKKLWFEVHWQLQMFTKPFQVHKSVSLTLRRTLA
jgi:hypothetical protein